MNNRPYPLRNIQGGKTDNIPKIPPDNIPNILIPPGRLKIPKESNPRPPQTSYTTLTPPQHQKINIPFIQKLPKPPLFPTKKNHITKNLQTPLAQTSTQAKNKPSIQKSQQYHLHISNHRRPTQALVQSLPLRIPSILPRRHPPKIPGREKSPPQIIRTQKTFR